MEAFDVKARNLRSDSQISYGEISKDISLVFDLLFCPELLKRTCTRSVRKFSGRVAPYI